MMQKMIQNGSWIAPIALAAGLVAIAAPALAQSPTPSRPANAPIARPRIEVSPAPRLLYRRCADWYEIQYRPSGTVLFPGKHCWWVRG